MNGLKAEARGKKQAPLYGQELPEMDSGELLEQMWQQGVQNPQTLAPNTREQFRRLTPTWRW